MPLFLAYAHLHRDNGRPPQQGSGVRFTVTRAGFHQFRLADKNLYRYLSHHRFVPIITKAESHGQQAELELTPQKKDTYYYKGHAGPVLDQLG